MSFNKPSMNGLNNFSIEQVDDKINTNISNIAINANNISTNISNIATNTGNISTNTGAIATNTGAISTNTTNIATNTGAISTNTTNIATNTGNISTNTGNISTNTTNIATNTGNISTNTTNIATNTGNISTNTTAIAGKQDTLTEGGGVDITGTTISLDLSTLTATQTLPTALEIVSNSDTQLLITASSDTSQDAKLILRGRRNGSSSNNHAELRFENYDQDNTGTEVKPLGSIIGRVSDAGNNYGGLLFNNFADGSTQTTAMTMSSNGNFFIGGGDVFQNNYTFRNNGSSKLTGLNYILPQLRLLSYDKDDIFGTTWGNGSTQTNITTDREIGESFSTDNGLGLIQLTKNGYYRIRVSAQTQSDGYNDRIGFMNYLRIVTSTTTTDYASVNSKNFFGWGYTRNNTDGGHQSVSFEDYIYLESGDTIQIRHKLETTGDRNFNNTLPSANIDNYLNAQIERIYDTNPE